MYTQIMDVELLTTRLIDSTYVRSILQHILCSLLMVTEFTINATPCTPFAGTKPVLHMCENNTVSNARWLVYLETTSTMEDRSIECHCFITVDSNNKMKRWSYVLLSDLILSDRHTFLINNIIVNSTYKFKNTFTDEGANQSISVLYKGQSGRGFYNGPGCLEIYERGGFQLDVTCLGTQFRTIGAASVRPYASTTNHVADVNTTLYVTSVVYNTAVSRTNPKQVTIGSRTKTKKTTNLITKSQSDTGSTTTTEPDRFKTVRYPSGTVVNRFNTFPGVPNSSFTQVFTGQTSMQTAIIPTEAGITTGTKVAIAFSVAIVIALFLGLVIVVYRTTMMSTAQGVSTVESSNNDTHESCLHYDGLRHYANYNSQAANDCSHHYEDIALTATSNQNIKLNITSE